MAAEQAPLLRTMEVSDVIDAAIRLYRHNFTQLLGIAAIIYVPVMGLQTVLLVELMNSLQSIKGERIPWAELSVLGLGMLGVLFLSAVLLPLAEGASCIAVSELYLGRKIGIREAYRRMMPSLWRLIWTYILVGLFIGVVYIVGLVLCILPGIAGYLWSMTILLFAWPVVVLEGIWGQDAMRRSHYLVKDYFWRVLGTWLLLNLIVGIGAQVVSVPVQLACTFALGQSNPLLAQIISQSVAMAMAVLIRPVNIIGVVLLYYDARIRKEGFDLQVMAAALGHGSVPPAGLATEKPVTPLFMPPPDVPLPPRPGEQPYSEPDVPPDSE